MTATLPQLPPEHHHDAEHLYFTAGQMRDFAEAAALAEREACAAECDKLAEDGGAYRIVSQDCADLIRARKDIE